MWVDLFMIMTSELDKLAQPSFRYQKLGSSALPNTSRFVHFVCWLMWKPRLTHFTVGLRAYRFWFGLGPQAPFYYCCLLVLRLNGFLLKMNHAGARTWMAECGSVSRFSNLKVNRHFLPFLCSCCCCSLLPCRISLSNVASEPRLESR